jgi:hypothetical protein
MAISDEIIEQIKVFDWLRFHGLDKFSFHIANERRSSIQAGALLKRMGVKAGVADIAIMKPSGFYAGLFIELKTEKGKVSPKQLEFLQTMRENGYDAVVCHGADRAIEHIKSYLMMSSI